MIITFDEAGLLVPDTKAYETMKELASKGEDVSIASESLVRALILLIVKDEISHEDVVVRFGETEIKFDQYGYADTWPKGFASVSQELNLEILKTQVAKRIKNRDSESN